MWPIRQHIHTNLTTLSRTNKKLPISLPTGRILSLNCKYCHLERPAQAEAALPWLGSALGSLWWRQNSQMMLWWHRETFNCQQQNHISSGGEWNSRWLQWPEGPLIWSLVWCKVLIIFFINHADVKIKIKSSRTTRGTSGSTSRSRNLKFSDRLRKI